MLEHHEALGTVAAAAIENGDTIIGSSTDTAENPAFSITIRTAQGNTTVGGTPHQGMLTAIHDRRLSYIDSFDPTGLPHITDVQSTVQKQDFIPSDGQVKILKWEQENDPVEYFDGFRLRKALYAFDDGFGLREYRTTIQEVGNLGAELMANVTDEFDIEMNAEEAADTSETGTDDGPDLPGIQ